MASQRDRLTQKDGQGITVQRTGKPKDEHTKHFVGADHKPTEEEALEMGRALYDAIVTEQAKLARRKK
jgi:hypothetical protein